MSECSAQHADGECGAAWRPATLAVRAGIDRDTAFGAVTPPIVLSSNFSFAGFDEKRRYDYTRSGNPTRDLLAEALADLEGGAGAVVTSTGMSAIALLLHALLKPGDRLIVPHDAYGGSWRLFNALAAKGAFELNTVNLTDPHAYAEALATKPAVVWIETPSNPLLRITDLQANDRCRACHRCARGGRQHLPFARAANADRVRCGFRRAFHHQVHQRS